jgi:hypothetical protein
VDPGDALGVHPGEGEGDQGADVPALGGVAVVAEAAHQLRPGAGDPGEVPAGLPGGAGEPVSGDGRDDQVERVGGVAAVRPGVGQRPDDVQELRH